VNFKYYLENPINLFKELEIREPKRRMSNNDEIKLKEIFENYKKLYCKPSLYQLYLRSIR